ncbi:MAG: glycosyltransferase family 2 protein [Lachnospiraceae bacterium]|nr:glycosyltransferase family 2 protein [Lachnospiraceae bacterium]
MNIAAIEICYNDDYKINEWEENYQFYKDALYRLIIIDNGSRLDFIRAVKERFNGATVVELGKNLGCTGAYNVGIRLALEDPNVDAIMLIGNDIKISSDDVKKLYNELENNSNIGMVAPVLLNKDSQVIADAGCDISFSLVLKPRSVGKTYDKLIISEETSSALTGGMNMASKSFYEAVGLQDESLFMYSDEVDMGIRAKRKNIGMKVVADTVAWHQHINPKKRMRRLPYTSYLIARNKVYLGRKHYGVIRAFCIFTYFIMLQLYMMIKNKLKHKDTENEKYAISGAWNGLIGNMKMPEDFQLC